jgi:phage-related protein
MRKMARETFGWNPDSQSKKTIKPNVTVLKFGDDYEQRQTIGLNRVKEEWSLTFQRQRSEVEKMDVFLTKRAGVESFYWKTPRNQTIIVVCDTHDVEYDRGAAKLTCTFRQVFES